MPVPPPPPPPGLPPPPAPGPPPAVDPKGRDLLLQSIRSGTKLKKTVTKDRSAPIIAGKTSSNGGGSTTESGVRNYRPAIHSGSATIARSNGLAGLFADGMPKLKPTGLNLGQQTQSSSLTSLPTSNHSSLHNNVRSEIGKRTVDPKHRGPPPQPPPPTSKAGLSTSISDSTLTSPLPSSHTRSQSTVSLQNGRIGPRKPTLLPKPPAPAPPPPVNSNTGLRKAGVSRAHSMRAPASPPILPQPPVFPSTELSRSPMFHASTDSLVRSARPRPPLRPPMTRPPPPPRSALPPPPPPVQPPPPPPPPSSHHRAAPPLPSGNPPPPPVRNSSMRNGSTAGDFEARFSYKFHKLKEFPPPPSFIGVTKVYNSRTAKGLAPAPPTHIQLGSRMWSRDSNC